MKGFPEHHWADLVKDWPRVKSDRLWRAYSDHLNRSVLSRFLRPGPIRRLLKTDLFDEAVAQGLDAFLRTRAETVVGMDISHYTAGAAMARGTKGPLVNADVRFLPFQDGAFDAVFSNSTLDHFRTWGDVRGALSELHRILRCGGQLVLTMDNRLNPAVFFRNLLPYPLLNRLGLVEYYVGSTCGPRRLRRTLVQAGFHVLELESILHCPRAAAVWMARWLRKHGSPAAREAYLRRLMDYEHLGRLPTRFLTGYFLAVRAERPGRQGFSR